MFSDRNDNDKGVLGNIGDGIGAVTRSMLLLEVLRRFTGHDEPLEEGTRFDRFIEIYLASLLGFGISVMDVLWVMSSWDIKYCTASACIVLILAVPLYVFLLIFVWSRKSTLVKRMVSSALIGIPFSAVVTALMYLKG